MASSSSNTDCGNGKVKEEVNEGVVKDVKVNDEAEKDGEEPQQQKEPQQQAQQEEPQQQEQQEEQEEEEEEEEDEYKEEEEDEDKEEKDEDIVSDKSAWSGPILKRPSETTEFSSARERQSHEDRDNDDSVNYEPPPKRGRFPPSDPRRSPG